MKEIPLLLFLLSVFCPVLLAAERIVVVGPVNNNNMHFLEALGDANLVDAKNRWSGENTIVVLLPPFIFDYDFNSVMLLKAAFTLSQEAHIKGGELKIVMGNSEKEFVDEVASVNNQLNIEPEIREWIRKSFVPFFTRNDIDVLVSSGVQTTENMRISSLTMSAEWEEIPYDRELCPVVVEQLKNLKKKKLIISSSVNDVKRGECHAKVEQLSNVSSKDESKIGILDYNISDKTIRRLNINDAVPFFEASTTFFKPIPMVEINAKLVTYAFGDFHGDLPSFLENLSWAQLIESGSASDIIKEIDEGRDPSIKWIGGRVNLVFTGDILDRGLHDILIWQIIRFLYPIVKNSGGHLEALLGNHELMNLMGIYRDVHPKLVETEELKKERRWKLSGGDPLGKFMRGLRAAVQIGKSVFVHGGIEPFFAELTLDKINAELRFQLSSLPYTYSDAHEIFAEDGPFWSRYFSLPNPQISSEKMCADLQKSLELLDNDSLGKPVRIVVAHTIQINRKIGTDCNGALIKIDIGLSRYVWEKNGRCPKTHAKRIRWCVKDHWQ
eukprot:Partr_v1_DN28687_c1_g1_i1_m49730 putative NA